jgi:small-conductance mechanosensitive channel
VNRFASVAIRPPPGRKKYMNNLIYIVGLVVVIIAVLSFFGLR